MSICCCGKCIIFQYQARIAVILMSSSNFILCYQRRYQRSTAVGEATVQQCKVRAQQQDFAVMLGVLVHVLEASCS